MIQTEVKKLGADEHAVHVHVPQEEYDRIYAGQLSKLSSTAKLPGFRPGKTPTKVIEQQFGPKLHEETVSELVQNHYVEAIESSGLTPALQPALDVPSVQPPTGFDFTLKVVTWPEVKLKNLNKLAVTCTRVEASDEDVQGVVDRLMKSQVRYEEGKGRKASKGDEVLIDFSGSVDGEPFEGGRGEDVRLVLGSGQFLPKFEQGLIGVKAGDEKTLLVDFPKDYTHKPLAGKQATFEILVKQVAAPVNAKDENELAKMVNFDDAKALRLDVLARLEREAEQASQTVTQKDVLAALLAGHDIDLPETMVQQDMRNSAMRIVQSMHERGVEPAHEMLEDETFLAEVRKRSEENLRLSVLLRTVRDEAGIHVDDAEMDKEIGAMAEQYPEDQQGRFSAWIRSQKDQMDMLRDRLIEKKCVEYILSKAKTKNEHMSLSAWQATQEMNKESL